MYKFKQGETAREAVDRIFGSDENFFQGDISKGRVFIHDLIHLITGESARSSRGEEAVAIYQAVLMKDIKVSTKVNLADSQNLEEKAPKLMDVYSKTIPQIRKFIGNYNVRNKRVIIPRKLNDKEILNTFGRAMALRDYIKEAFGKPFHRIPLEDLEQAPMSELDGIAKSAFATYGKISNSNSFRVQVPSFDGPSSTYSK